MRKRSSEYGSLVIVAASKYYAEYRAACADYLSDIGWKIHVQDDFTDIASFDGLLVVGMAFYRWVPFIPGQFRVGIQGEQMPLPDDNDWTLHRNRKRFDAMSRYYDLVIEWSPSNYCFTSCRSPYVYLPHGAPKRSLKSPADEWDVVFLGSPYGGRGRRIALLAALEKEFHVCPIRESWGNEKYRLINSARICLNLHQFSSACYESPRLFELLSEGAFVLSERIENSFPFVPGRDYVSFVGQNEMIDKVRYYLEHSDERRAIAESGNRTALGYPQEKMFHLLSIELQRCSILMQPLALRMINWANGIWKTSIIEAIDLAAKIKRRLIKKS